MKLCGTEIAPGQRKTVLIPVAGAAPLRAVVFCGNMPGKTLVATAGVHGCEYVGIEALRRLEKRLQPEQMHGNVIVLPVVNEAGFYAGAKQIIPADGKNLNRVFPGAPDGTHAERIAHAIETALYPCADLLADFHGGDCNERLCPLVFIPTAGEVAVNAAALDAAKVLSVSYRVRSTAKNGLYSWAVQQGIPAILVERGGQGRWTEAEVAACQADVLALMRHLRILEENAPLCPQVEIAQAVYEEAEASGLWYPAVDAGETVSEGALLGRLHDLSEARMVEIRAKFDGVVLYYTTALGVCQGDPLIAYGRA